VGRDEILRPDGIRPSGVRETTSFLDGCHPSAGCQPAPHDIPIRIVTSLKKSALLLAAALPLFAAAIDYAAEGKLWWAHIQFLADDKLLGRNIGTPEFQMAVDYVSGQFRQLGLKPAGVDGYLQPIQFEARTLVPESSSLTLIRDGKEELLELGMDFPKRTGTNWRGST
jgi:hypothetical protein